MDATTKKYYLLLVALAVALIQRLTRLHRLALQNKSNITHFHAVARQEIERWQLQAQSLGSQLAIEQLENTLPDDQEIARVTHSATTPVHLTTPTKRDGSTLLELALAGTTVAARTALAETFRKSAIAIYAANGADGWIWVVEGNNPCPFCLSMEGTIHPIDEDFESHPNCQCTTEPYFT